MFKRRLAAVLAALMLASIASSALSVSAFAAQQCEVLENGKIVCHPQK
jgi:hypothetical protein